MNDKSKKQNNRVEDVEMTAPMTEEQLRDSSLDLVEEDLAVVTGGAGSFMSMLK